jgi:hypothetical protein
MPRLSSIAALALFLALPSAALARSVPACESAPCASDTGPILLLSYYRGGVNLQKLVRVVNAAHLPAGLPVYYGDYWGSGAHGQHVPRPPGRHPRPEMEAGRYAPIFPIQPSTFWANRELGPDDLRTLAHPGLAGTLPPLSHLLSRSSRLRYQVSLELGRRFRDRIRIKRAAGKRVVTWQLDELPSELAGPQRAAVLGFLSGVMKGIAYGRPELGDQWLPGIVFATPQALAVAGGPARGRERSFWRTLDRVSLYLVGEEYPAFVGSPIRAARRSAGLRRRMWRRGGARRSLARKYVAGMTPGYRLQSGLGGNVHHLSQAAVTSWRLRYIRARAREDLAGLGQYMLAYGNARVPVLQDVVAAIVRGARLLPRARTLRR